MAKSREDWLCEQLDRDDLSNALRAKYDAELDKIANSMSVGQAKKQEFKAKEEERIAIIRAQLIAGNINVIDAFGIPEFGSDYEVCIEGTTHVVYSKVARDDQTNRHAFNTFDEANSKFRKLVWDRLYTQYVRMGEVNHLSELAS